jgi:hypothetical protein
MVRSAIPPDPPNMLFDLLNLPAAHSLQLLAANPEYLPEPQVMQLLAASKEYSPLSQLLHEVADVPPAPPKMPADLGGVTHPAPSKYHDEIISLVFIHTKYGEPIVIMVFRRAIQKVLCWSPKKV